jgi:outer membrane protein assembly factor BamD (BamD/ComL family)
MKIKFLSAAVLLAAFVFTACSNQTPEEKYKSALNKIEKENYSDAIMDLEKIAYENPDSKVAPDALVEIGKLYYGKAVKNLTTKETMGKALEYYNKAYDRYPESDVAPKALFMMAFVQANELNQLDKARDNYTKFLQNYPSHELAESAKIELENLGVPPEEILKK